MSAELEPYGQQIMYENDPAAAWHAQVRATRMEEQQAEKSAEVIELLGRKAVVTAEETATALIVSRRFT